MKRLLTFALVAGVAVTGCRDNPTAAPVDAPTVAALKNLTKTTLGQLAIGVTAQDRSAFVSTGAIVLPEILARDIYRIDASEGRYVTETLGGQADPGSFAGGSGFAGFYTAARAANQALISLRTPPANTFTAGEIAASRGFFRTMKAISFYRVLELRDSLGIPLQTDDPYALTPIYCKPFVLNYIAALLDSANADLVAAGTDTVPFTLPGSWRSHGRNYDRTANLIKFNRGWKGKVDFYRAMQNRTAPDQTILNAAIAELTAALGAAEGAVPAAQLPYGVYYEFAAAPDMLNPLADAKIAANNNFVDSVRFVQTNSALPWDPTDTRYGKIVQRGDFSTGGITGNGLTALYTISTATATSANQTNPIALLKDEELVLLRAQANAELNTATSLLASHADANAVHRVYATNDLPPFTSRDVARALILREKRLSLLLEGPQRLVDLRAYGYLNGNVPPLGNGATLPKELSTDPFNSTFPIPRAELNARGGSVGACSAS